MKKELIQQARQTNLAEYLQSVGVPLVKVGNRYRHPEHDSLTFTGNAYFWNSQQESGNALDYLTRHMNVGFVEAVSALTQTATISEPKQIAAFKEGNLSINYDSARVRTYLSKTRYIADNIINYCVDNKLLLQENETNNAVFPMYDEYNNMVGAERQGTTEKRFKGVAKGSRYGYGFNIRFSDDNTYDYSLFFESAIDLISFIDYKRSHDKKSLDRCIFVSMAGLKINVLRHTLQIYKGDLKVVLCVDNDDAGQAFKNNFQRPFIDSSPIEPFKDWNEQLTRWRAN